LRMRGKIPCNFGNREQIYLEDKSMANKVLKIIAEVAGVPVLLYGWLFACVILSFSTLAAKLLIP